MFVQKIALFLVSLVSFVVPAYADSFSNSNSGSAGVTASAPAATTALSSKLLHCSKNYGRVVFEQQATSPAISMTFTRVGLSPMLATMIIRDAAKEAGCFTLVERGTPGAKFLLKVEMAPPTLGNDVNTGKHIGLSMIPIFGGLLANRELQKEVKHVYFSDAQVSMTLVNIETGESVAGVVGMGTNTDVSLGVALLDASKGTFPAAKSQDASMQVVATEIADGFNQLVPFMETLGNAAPVASDTQASSVVAK